MSHRTRVRSPLEHSHIPENKPFQNERNSPNIHIKCVPARKTLAINKNHLTRTRFITNVKGLKRNIFFQSERKTAPMHPSAPRPKLGSRQGSELGTSCMSFWPQWQQTAHRLRHRCCVFRKFAILCHRKNCQQGALGPSGQPCPDQGVLRELIPGPLAPEARILPLDQIANVTHVIHEQHQVALCF